MKDPVVQLKSLNKTENIMSKETTLVDKCAEKLLDLFTGQELLLTQARGCGLKITVTKELRDAMLATNHPSAESVAANIRLNN